MKSHAISLSVAACLAAIVYFLVHRPEGTPADRQAFDEYVSRSGKEEKLAPVQLWGEAVPEVKGESRARKAARFTLIHGEAFSGEARIPLREIRAFLDSRVSSGEIHYVVVFTTKGSKWGEIFPVLDECRKSRVRIVLLNHYES